MDKIQDRIKITRQTVIIELNNTKYQEYPGVSNTSIIYSEVQLIILQ